MYVTLIVSMEELNTTKTCRITCMYLSIYHESIPCIGNNKSAITIILYNTKYVTTMIIEPITVIVLPCS
jgi:hypothetical protein